MVRDGYDKIVKKYQAIRHVFDNRRELEEIASVLPKGATVLDVGCGAGLPVAELLVEAGFDVTGVDFSENMLRMARRNVPKANLIKGDMTRLGFKDNSFDGLTASYSIIHVPREKHYSLFQSFHRILKPHGVMLDSMGSDAWQGTDEYHGAKMSWSHYDPERSSQMIRDAGFKIVFGKQINSGGEEHYWVLAENKK